MKEALHPLDAEFAVEIDAPTEFDAANTGAELRSVNPVYALAPTALLAACGSGGGGGGNVATPAPPPVAQVAKPSTDAEAARFILKASLSVTEAEISNIKSVGYEP